MFGGNKAAYVDAARTSNWAAFEWTVTEVVHDGGGLFFVYLDLADSSELPDVLVTRSDDFALLRGLDPRDRPHLGVRLDLQASGIWG